MKRAGQGAFIVLSTQRSGSTWLIDVLNRVEETTAYGELLLRQKRVWDVGALDYPRFVESSHRRASIRPLSTFAYLDELFGRPGAVGFKLMYSQVRLFPEVLLYLRLRRVRVVHLVRRNALDVIVSSALKKQSHRAHVLADQQVETNTAQARVAMARRDAEAAVQVELDVDALPGQLRRQQRKTALASRGLRALGLPHLEVRYEELKRSPEAFEPVWAFLGINAAGVVPQTDMVRIRTQKRAQVIRNYDAVVRVLAGTEFAGLLD